MGNAHQLPGGIVVDDIRDMHLTIDAMLGNDKERARWVKKESNIAFENCRRRTACEKNGKYNTQSFAATSEEQQILAYMKTILFICPYFGKLPIAHMKLWLLSCEKNPTINWLILTDDYTEELKYPSNVKVVYTTLEAIKQQVQKMFDFPIYLDHPYKLCDYKPAYGYIFLNYTKVNGLLGNIW